ncbi:hypothetical protein BH09MYX1_BH09MYX1_20870 [soil metagenome]
MRPQIAFAIALATLSLSTSASATPTLDTLGPVGSRGGFTSAVSDPSAASAYFNPAMLGDAKDDFLLGFSVLTEQISLTLDGRRSGGDVPLAVGGRDIVGPGGQPIPNQTVPTQWLQEGCETGTNVGQCPAPAFAKRARQAAGSSNKTYAYLTLGAVKQLVKDRLTIGLFLTLPLVNLTTARSFYNDEREALFGNSLHPELYGDRLTEISIALAASFRILKGLDFGLGTTIGLSNQASAQTYVRESANYDSLLLNNDIAVQAALSPIVGVRWTPIDRLRFGGVLHAPHSLEIDASIGAPLPTGTSSATTRKQVHDWLPWRIGIAAEADFLKTAHYTGTVAAQVEWGAWSGYQDRHGASPQDYGADLAWKNTLTWSVGVKHHWKSLAGYMDFQYAPSPVPLQVGQSNYVDSDRFGAATGASLDFTLGGVHLRPGIQLVGYRMAYRYQKKDDARLVDELPDGSRFGSTGDPVPGARGLQTNNPGWPGFTSEGWVYGGSLVLDVLM